MSDWITNKSQMTDFLESLDIGDTFAIQFNNRTVYATVKKIPGRRVRLFDVNGYGYAKIGTKTSPMHDHETSWYILESEDNGELMCGRIGPNPKDVNALHPDATSVDYSSDKTMGVRCGECGNSAPVPVSKFDGPFKNRGLEDMDGDFVTPCCKSDNWTTIMM